VERTVAGAFGGEAAGVMVPAAYVRLERLPLTAQWDGIGGLPAPAWDAYVGLCG